MKKTILVTVVLTTLLALLASACGPTAPTPAPVEDTPEIAIAPEPSETSNADTDILNAFYYQRPQGWVADVASVKLAEAILWAARALDEVPKG